MSLTKQLQEAIRAYPESMYAISKATGVADPIILRFLSGERGIAIGSMEKLCDYLGLELAPKVKPNTKPKRKRRGK